MNKVLLVEDDNTLAFLTSELLTAAGFEVGKADTGQKAIDMHQDYNIILMDIGLPDFNGMEATKQIRAAGYTCPIIALSGRESNADQQEALDSGMDAFLTKGTVTANIIATLEAYLDRAAA